MTYTRKADATGGSLTLQRMMRNALDAQGMTQIEAARRSGLSAQYIGDVLAGRRKLSARAAIALENVVNLSAWDMMAEQLFEELECARERVSP
jgi:transcriptional regulator with XRE-family HTH domain